MKLFVIDTCIFIDDPDCIFKLEDNEIVVPFKVIEELDKHKDSSGSKGEGARSAIRNIYNLTQTGEVSEGVKLENGGIFRVDRTDPRTIEIPLPLDFSDPDNAILAVTYLSKKKNPHTVLITNDINLRIKAECLKIETQKYENRTVKKVENLFSPYHRIDLDASQLDEYVKKGHMSVSDKLYPNQFVLFRAHGSKQSAMGRFNQITNKIEKLRYSDREPCGIRGRNLEQRFAIDLLMDDECKLVNLVGKAGTGKTILALAAALQKVMHENIYSRIVIARPIVTLAKSHDIGFLPGSVNEKLLPWTQPMIDNLEIILDLKDGKKEIEEMIQRRQIEFCALAYIRGRNIENSFIIIDEAQQLLPRECKAIITRVGENSKLVMTGDPYQVDHQYLDEVTNGLSYVIEKFRHEQISGHAVLEKCERSALASIAADIL